MSVKPADGVEEESAGDPRNLEVVRDESVLHLVSTPESRRFGDEAISSHVAASMSGFLDASFRYGEEIQRINAGVIDALGPQLARFREQFAALTTTLAPTVNALFGPLLQDFGRRIGPLLDAYFPGNWRNVDLPDDELLEAMVLDEGLPLAWVPPKKILKRLLEADDARSRRRIIGRSWRSITNDCLVQLDHVTSHEGRRESRFAALAIEALRAGHTEAAQALAGNQLETLCLLYAPDWKKRFANRNSRPDLDALSFRHALVVGAIWAAYRSYRPGDAVPRAFSRHATAHGVSRAQYSRLNATIAIMHLTALLRLLEVERFE